MEEAKKIGKALCMYSGGLDSQLAICVLKEQGIEATALIYTSPFFGDPSEAKKSAEALGVPVMLVDFTDDLVELIKAPKHGFGSCMNPCIDCHARMMTRAGEIMEEQGFDFVATGEVMGQRPMSQQKHALIEVQKTSGIGDRVLRPLSAKFLEPTAPERDGIVDRERLLALEGRNRKPQIELAKKYGIKKYPSPAGGCKLTEPQYSARLRNLMNNEGLDDKRLIRLLNHGRVFRLPGGTLAFAGRNKSDNEAIRAGLRGPDILFRSFTVVGPSVLCVAPKCEEDIILAQQICAAYADHKGAEEVGVRCFKPARKPEDLKIRVVEREQLIPYMI